MRAGEVGAPQGARKAVERPGGDCAGGDIDSPSVGVALVHPKTAQSARRAARCHDRSDLAPHVHSGGGCAQERLARRRAPGRLSSDREVTVLAATSMSPAWGWRLFTPR